MRRLVVEYWVCNQLFSSTNFFNVFNAFPLSNDSRAMATHSSIGLAGSMACMAKEALISTQSVWALVALFSSTLLKILTLLRECSHHRALLVWQGRNLVQMACRWFRSDWSSL